MLPSQQKFNENGPNILIHKGLVWSKKFYALVFEKKKTTNQNAKMKWFSFYFKYNTLFPPAALTYRVRSDWLMWYQLISCGHTNSNHPSYLT